MDKIQVTLVSILMTIVVALWIDILIAMKLAEVSATAYQRGFNDGKVLSKEELKSIKSQSAIMWWSNTDNIEDARKRMCQNVSQKPFKKE